jgi:hypothetical protein
MNWAQQRRLTYISIVVAFFAIVGFAIYHKATDVPPTCFDHKQDGTETGVDCGGGCNVYCVNQLADPIVEWVRVFPVTPGIVDAVAYIQDSNPNAVAQQVNYNFNLYDANNTLLAQRSGSTYLGPAGETAIVETLIPVKGTVTLARFSFVDPIYWQKPSADFSQIVINTDRNTTSLFYNGSVASGNQPAQANTRLTVLLQNQSRYSFINLDAIAIFYDANGNAITASKILVPELGALQNETVYFTWPYPVSNIARTQIITRFNPFTAQSL